MRSIFLLFCCLFLTFEKGQAAPFAWSPSTTIDNTLLLAENVSTVYDFLHNRTFAAWLDLTTKIPTYSIYENGTWSTPRLIDASMTAEGLRNVYLSYDSLNDRVFAAWTETSGMNYYPAYSIFSSGSWSAPSLIGTSIPVVGGDVFLCYNSSENSVFATWGSYTGAPAYSIFNHGTWSPSGHIDASSFVGLNVYTCYHSAQNKVIATWADAGDGGLPAYSVHDGTSWSQTQHIGDMGSTDNVFPCYNSTDDLVIATWVDVANNKYPTYAIYNGSTWNTPSVIASSAIEGFAVSLFSCYDSKHNQIFATWAIPANCDPTYSIYSNGTWKAPAQVNIAPPGVYQDIFLSYNSKDDEVFATWTDCDSSLAYFSIYADTQSISPPINLKGIQRSNGFLTQTDWFDKISWNPPTGGPTPAFYEIYRNNLNTLIGTVHTGSWLQFEDHNRRKRQAYIYLIISVDSHGNKSPPASITIPGES